MAEEVGDVFSVIARSGELIIQIARVAAAGVGSRQGRLERQVQREQLRDLRAERAQALMRRQTQGQVPAGKLLEAYGPERTGYARLAESQLPQFMQAAAEVRVPYAVIHLQADGTGSGDALIAYCTDHSSSIQALFEMTQAELLSEKEGTDLAAAGVPEAAADFEKLFVRAVYEPEELTFMTCYIRPDDAARISAEMNRCGVPHLISDELGIIRSDPQRNGCLTFFGEDMQSAAAALRAAQVQLAQPEPEILKAEVIAREAYAHKIHRLRYEAQEAQKVRFFELTALHPVQELQLLPELRQADVDIVKAQAADRTDILIAEEDLRRAQECARRAGIRQEFAPVGEQKLKAVWEVRCGREMERFRERVQKGRPEKERSRPLGKSSSRADGRMQGDAR